MLVCFWQCRVGRGNLIPVTPSSSVASSQLPDDVLRFYEDAGVDAFAREVCTLRRLPDEEVAFVH